MGPALEQAIPARRRHDVRPRQPHRWTCLRGLSLTGSVDQALLLFGPPSSVTGFYRGVPGTTSRTDNWFTVVLQYEGKDLVVTVKTMMGSYLYVLTGKGRQAALM